MPENYFSDRELGPKARVKQEVDAGAWGGLYALIQSFVDNGGFGIDYPEECRDGSGTAGTNAVTFALAIRSEIPALQWPLNAELVPDTLTIMDLLEFCYEHVAQPIQGDYHSYWRHYHLTFDREAGRQQFLDRANRILARNQLAYQLNYDGTLTRIASPILHETLVGQLLETGDNKLDQLLVAARAKFLDPDATVRREAMEKLWDAFERVKSLENPANKKDSVRLLLDKAAAEPEFRGLLDSESRTLTEVGNKFHIRHSEKGQIEIRTEEQVDYLFHRLFALIWLALRARS
jgi:hypothetical protein